MPIFMGMTEDQMLSRQAFCGCPFSWAWRWAGDLERNENR